MLDFQKLDPFWNLWSKPNPGISSKMLYPARLNHNLERKIGHEIFVKTEKTEYLSNQLTYAYFDRKFIFPIKFGTSEQIFNFWISKMFQISESPTVKRRKFGQNSKSNIFGHFKNAMDSIQGDFGFSKIALLILSRILAVSVK